MFKRMSREDIPSPSSDSTKGADGPAIYTRSNGSEEAFEQKSRWRRLKDLSSRKGKICNPIG